MGEKTIEIKLKLSQEEFNQLRESLERSVNELSDELDEAIEDEEHASEVANKIQASQSVRCKIAIQAQSTSTKCIIR